MAGRTDYPRHVAIIMDGNGRWAQQRHLSRVQGHRQGAETCRKIVRMARREGLEQLTLFCLSSENWKRPAEELNALFALLVLFLTETVPELIENNIRLETIGRREPVASDVLTAMDQAQAATAGCDGLVLRLALNYGARAEITDAVRRIVEDWRDGHITGDPNVVIDEATVTSRLYSPAMPDPDLLIRTGNESRLSNFLLWQISYTELYFSPVYWPDFDEVQFRHALTWYTQRHRRFGAVSDNMD
ncbi:MAG: polyprenyl diphosphate synthase [Planctomycetia bacterium]|nr:polyprenyl diphosphate synthase [Planctomycetia bacterium]